MLTYVTLWKDQMKPWGLDPDANPDALSAWLSLARPGPRGAGVSHVMISASWADVEPKEGAFDLAPLRRLIGKIGQKGLLSMVVLDAFRSVSLPLARWRGLPSSGSLCFLCLLLCRLCNGPCSDPALPYPALCRSAAEPVGGRRRRARGLFPALDRQSAARGACRRAVREAEGGVCARDIGKARRDDHVHGLGGLAALTGFVGEDDVPPAEVTLEPFLLIVHMESMRALDQIAVVGESDRLEKTHPREAVMEMIVAHDGPRRRAPFEIRQIQIVLVPLSLSFPLLLWLGLGLELELDAVEGGGEGFDD